MKRYCFAGWVVFVETKDRKYPLISAYRMVKTGLKWANTLQITDNGCILGLSPAGEGVPEEIFRFMIDKALENGAKFG